VIIIMRVRIESSPRESIEKQQIQKLRYQLWWAYQNSPFYNKLYKNAKLNPNDIKSTSDLKKIPIITDAMLKEEVKTSGDPFANILCVEIGQVFKNFSCSDFSMDNSPYFFAYSFSDWEQLTALVGSYWLDIGVKSGDIFMSTNANENPSKFLMEYSIRHVNAIVLDSDKIPPVDGPRGIRLSTYVKPDVLLVSLPIADFLAAETQELGDPKLLNCYRIIIFTDGILTKEKSNEYRKAGFIGEHYYFRYSYEPSFYAIDCKEHNGVHVAEDFYITEITDPETGEPVSEGEKGKLTITNLSTRATPFIRFQTNDIVTKIEKPCGCGSNFARLMYE